MRDELAARAQRRERQSREGRLAEAHRQLDRLAERRARVSGQFVGAEVTGGETEALAAELDRIDQRRADLEVYLQAATRPLP
jgi:hypothetical protein